MAYTFVGTDQKTWTKVAVVTTDGNLLSNGEYCHKTTAVSGAINLASLQANGFAIQFYGKNKAGEDHCRALVRIWGLCKVTGGGTDERVGIVLCTLLVELGDGTASTGIFAGDTYHFAHKIFPLSDKTLTPPGIRVIGDADDAFAMALFDSLGVESIVIQVTNQDEPVPEPNPTLAIGFLWRPV